MDTKDLRQQLETIIDEMSVEEQQALLQHLVSESPSDRRIHPRKPYVVDVAYESEGEAYQDLTRDISAGGLSLDTRDGRREFRIGQELLITIPDSQYIKQYTVRAIIVRISDQEIGVKFIT